MRGSPNRWRVRLRGTVRIFNYFCATCRKASTTRRTVEKQSAANELINLSFGQRRSASAARKRRATWSCERESGSRPGLTRGLTNDTPSLDVTLQHTHDEGVGQVTQVSANNNAARSPRGADCGKRRTGVPMVFCFFLMTWQTRVISADGQTLRTLFGL